MTRTIALALLASLVSVVPCLAQRTVTLAWDASTALAPGVLTGTIKPKLPGAQIAIERRKGSTWVLVGEVTADATGAFELEVDAAVPAGSYRARSAPISGFVAGISPTVQVLG